MMTTQIRMVRVRKSAALLEGVETGWSAPIR